MASNPFKYGRVVSGNDFFGRKDLLSQLSGYIDSGQNVVLYGERRVGKTSLIHEVARNRREKLLYVDFMNVRSEDDICRRILRELIALNESGGYLKKIFNALSHLRPTFSIDPVTMAPEIKLDAAVHLEISSVAETLVLIDKFYGGKVHSLVVAFDEFQSIGDLKAADDIYALMRSKIQLQKIPYIFAGSNRHRLDRVFTDPKSPFFKSATPLSVGLFPREEFMGYISEKFKTGERKVDKTVLDGICELCRDIPGDVQQVCEAIWSITTDGDIVSSDILKGAMELIFSRERGAYECIMGELTDVQARCLVAIARVGGGKVYSKQFSKESGITTGTAQVAIRRLLAKGVIYETNNVYEFVNPFFRHWIKVNE
ncbi:MAG: hypothetical protein CSYNP_04163 [Syntrophus sp. SKADARSKE-3]|nr:hypothetical protein [Syntrophus sp. SKADARSKE-3]